ncbi:uncharacterized protein LOC109203873 isoform X4 [Oreochromis niloticus]|uniref:uncharacterized protein LOC109203873 isoform X4 n=1 Tax=Oreochromis niloticus TaxID=8128 RepID=UPI000904B732|nr:uncharacterized protein LOC109203873 isoform X4 [Oreochromis niloticus]
MSMLCPKMLQRKSPVSLPRCPRRNCDSFTMSDYLVGVVGPNSIGISSLKSLFDQTNISDEVIDGLIYLQCENFPHIYPIPSQITGKILDGSIRAQSAYFLKKNIFQMYEKLIGACLENGSHWTLFFCDIPKRTIVYMNSFGESEVRKSAVLKNWSSFASARGCTGEWTLSHVSHPHQQDGNSCGVHVIMFAQSLIEGKTHVEEYNTEIPKLRSRLCHYLFSSIDRTRKCSQCWCVIAAKDRVQCQKCGAYKHMRCSKSVCGICIFCESKSQYN